MRKNSDHKKINFGSRTAVARSLCVQQLQQYLSTSLNGFLTLSYIRGSRHEMLIVLAPRIHTIVS